MGDIRRTVAPLDSPGNRSRKQFTNICLFFSAIKFSSENHEKMHRYERNLTLLKISNYKFKLQVS